MKKLQIISEKIESSNNNYFGRGSFETVIKNNSDLILSWFEDLTSIQNQIRILNDEYGCVNLQKRNYVRIITKLFPQEYNQFVCVNILLRDIDSITLAFLENNDSKKQYSLLLANNRLKFPGKHKKIVDFEIYQQFITLYANDLIEKSQDFETEEKLDLNVNLAGILENSITDEISEETEEIETTESKMEEISTQSVKEESTIDKNNYIQNENKNIEKDKTNWMNVLLKGI